MKLESGSSFGHYEIRSKIGERGMGEVRISNSDSRRRRP